MRRRPRGGPGELDVRLARAEQLVAAAPDGTERPLAVLAAVLRHQRARAATIAPAGRRLHADRFPLLDVDGATPIVVDEVAPAVDTLRGSVTPPLREAGDQLRALRPSELTAVVETWLDDTALVEPRIGFWVHVSAGAVLERGACAVDAPDDWRGGACPVCGGPPQASVIAEESGEFMAGSPRALVCGRCASWWPFSRATCPGCGEEGSRSIESFLVETRRWVRVDTCAVCRGYIKTFDLRQPGAVDVVPLVDDVATLTLDVWAQERGFTRAARSVAGV